MEPASEVTSPTVFLSYAHANTERVQTISRWLRGWGYTVWMDKADIDAGADWRVAIQTAIATTDFFLLALSKSSLNSEVVDWELSLAEEAGKRIIPIVFGGGKLDTSISRRVASLHWISFQHGNEQGMGALAEALGGIRSEVAVLPGDVKFPAIGQNARMIAELARLLQEYSHSGGAAIFTGGREWRYYIQFYAVASEANIYGEAVGNANLEGDALLDSDRLSALAGLGWDPPTDSASGNFNRTWIAMSGRDRAVMAGDIMRTFLEIYGHLPGERLQLEVQIND